MLPNLSAKGRICFSPEYLLKERVQISPQTSRLLPPTTTFCTNQTYWPSSTWDPGRASFSFAYFHIHPYGLSHIKAHICQLARSHKTHRFAVPPAFVEHYCWHQGHCALVWTIAIFASRADELRGAWQPPVPKRCGGSNSEFWSGEKQ